MLENVNIIFFFRINIILKSFMEFRIAMSIVAVAYVIVLDALLGDVNQFDICLYNKTTFA
jgi:hypothetical protein